MIVIADTGPLLHLFWVGALSWALPPQPIDVVAAVWQEVASHAPEILDDPRLRQVTSPSELPETLRAWKLDAGEEAALSYALAQRGQAELLVLCDERQARKACQLPALPVVGSVGLIVEAFRANRVSKAEATAALLALPERGRLHIRRGLIEAAVAALDNPNPSL